MLRRVGLHPSRSRGSEYPPKPAQPKFPPNGKASKHHSDVLTSLVAYRVTRATPVRTTLEVNNDFLDCAKSLATAQGGTPERGRQFANNSSILPKTDDGVSAGHQDPTRLGFGRPTSITGPRSVLRTVSRKPLGRLAHSKTKLCPPPQIGRRRQGTAPSRGLYGSAQSIRGEPPTLFLALHISSAASQPRICLRLAGHHHQRTDAASLGLAIRHGGSVVTIRT